MRPINLRKDKTGVKPMSNTGQENANKYRDVTEAQTASNLMEK